MNKQKDSRRIADIELSGVINDRTKDKCPSDHDPVVVIAEF